MDVDRGRRRLLRSSRASQSCRTRRTLRADNLTTVWRSDLGVTKGGIPTKAAYKDLAAHDVDRIFAAGTTGEFTSLIEEERLDVCETPAQARAATRPSGT